VTAPRILALAAACFALLTLAVITLDTTAVDVPVRDALLAHASPGLLAAMRVINEAGHWPVLLPATLVMVLALRRAREHWYVWVGLMLVALAMPDMLKIVVGRPRPEAASMGFPSGHATAATAFFGALIHLAQGLPRPARRLVSVVAVVVIVLVAVARVTLRAHWPTDAAGGIALGAALASAAALIDRRRAS
jgi:undecaprenyl-diphosphatase